MKTIADPSVSIPVVERFDVFVAGGGMTGVAAVLLAARMGVKSSSTGSSTAWEVSQRQGTIFEERHVVNGLPDWNPLCKKRDL